MLAMYILSIICSDMYQNTLQLYNAEHIVMLYKQAIRHRLKGANGVPIA